jgi:hypothetical protein
MEFQCQKASEEQVRNLPPDWWQHAAAVDALVKYFRSHIVGLLFGGSTHGKFQYFLFTGFLSEHNNELLWLTAGHVIDNITASFNSPNFSLSVMRWLDGYDVPGAESVPVNVAQLRMKSWTSTGLDFGAVALPLLEKHNILANKQLTVMNEEVWKNLKQAAPEGYYVIGYPRIWNEFTETPVEGNKILRSIKADIACLPVQPVYPPTDTEQDPFWDNCNAFYGQLLKFPDMTDFKIEDIVGMSGGPILSIERTPDAKFAYRLAGIQIKWKPESEIVCAEPIETIASVLSNWP